MGKISNKYAEKRKISDKTTDNYNDRPVQFQWKMINLDARKKVNVIQNHT